MEQNIDENISEEWIPGFWKRIGALLIDSLFLGILGWLLGFMFGDYFASLGGFGRIIGFIVALMYFGVMNSNISSGQSIGKKLMKLRVVNSKNNPIGLPKSMLRFIILGIPFFINGALFGESNILSIWSIISSFIVFGGSFAIIYLYIFNKPTRQSLHDLFIGTYVVNAEAEQKNIQPIWRPHFFVVGILFLLSFFAPLVLNNLAKEKPFSDLLNIQKVLLNNSSVKYAMVQVGKTNFSSFSESSSSTYMSVQIYLVENDIENKNLAHRFAEQIIKLYPETEKKDVLQITFVYGYDIGIASKWTKYTYKYNPLDL